MLARAQQPLDVAGRQRGEDARGLGAFQERVRVLEGLAAAVAEAAGDEAGDFRRERLAVLA